MTMPAYRHDRFAPIDPELADLLRPWLSDRTPAAAAELIGQFLEKDRYLRGIVIAQREQLCDNEDEMATYDDEAAALKKRISDLEAQIAKPKTPASK